MKWKRFLLSAAFLSKVHRLYIFMYSFSVIFLSSLSSNSHSILSTQLFAIFIPIFLRTSLTSNSVKYLFPQHAESQLNTLIKYFSSVGLIWNSSSFSSIVFCFSALRAWSLLRSKLSFLLELLFSFSKTGEFLYFCCRWTGRSLYLNFFFVSSLLFQNILDYIIIKSNHKIYRRCILIKNDTKNKISSGFLIIDHILSQQHIILFYCQRYNLMSDIKINRSADQLENMLNQTLANMHQHQKNANYVEAENHRLTAEQLRKDLEARRVYEMEQRHNQEHNDLNHAHQEELTTFNALWDRKLNEYVQEGDKLIKDLEAKHQAQLESQRNQLEKQLPYKVKESSEFLNLKKMEEHMAKQKLYTEAHKVQQRLAQLQKSEKEAWINARNLKIQTSLNTLRAKQATELAALQKKIKTGLDEQNKQRHKQQERINLKYANIGKQLKSNHEKQILAFRGQFRSKGGQGSPLLLTKSKLLSSK